MLSRSNIFVINCKLFENSLNINGKLKEWFEQIIKFNLLKDVNSLINFHEEYGDALHNSHEMILDFEKRGILKIE